MIIRLRLGLILILFALVGCGRVGTPVSSPSPRPTTTTLPPAASQTPTATVSPTSTPTPPAVDPLQVSLSWRYSTLEMVWAVAAEDLNGDGQHELVAGSYDKHVYTLSPDGRLLWQYRTGGPVYSLDVGDVEGDGTAEVVIGGDDNRVHVLRGDGELVWQQDTGSRVVAVRIADIDGDGAGEVVAGCWDGQLWLWRADGELQWQRSSQEGVSAVETADLDQNGQLEILVGHRDGTVSALGASGDPLWSFHAGGHVRELAARDVDADARGEIVVGSADGRLHVLSDEGVLRWKRSLEGPILTLDVADLDADGRGEIVVGTGHPTPRIHLLSHSGELRWTYEVQDSVWSVRAADVDGDGIPEILAGGDDGSVRILDRYGRLRGQYHTARRVHGLALGDESGGGYRDIVARAGNDVYLLSLARGETVQVEPQASSEPTTLARWTGPLPGAAERDGDLIELVAVGDVLLSRTVEERMEPLGSSYPFQAVGEVLRGADITVGNLECPLSLAGEPINKRFVFRAHPRHADALTWAGFDLVSLASNHLMDFGMEGFSQTLEALRDRGVAYVGAGYSYEEAHTPLISETRGRKVAFLSYAASRWKGSSEVPTEDLISFADAGTIGEDVRRAKEVSDLVVVILHLGTEYLYQPDEEQLAVSRAAVDAGACLVIGHHSHVVQGTKTYDGGFVAYGLGNFVFDIDVVEGARDGAILRVLLGDEGVEAADLIPVRIVDDVQPRFLSEKNGLPVVRPLFRAPGR